MTREERLELIRDVEGPDRTVDLFLVDGELYDLGTEEAAGERRAQPGEDVAMQGAAEGRGGGRGGRGGRTAGQGTGNGGRAEVVMEEDGVSIAMTDFKQVPLKQEGNADLLDERELEEWRDKFKKSVSSRD